MHKPIARLTALLAAIFVSNAAFAQGVVQQVGPVVPGHPAVWNQNGQIIDSANFPGPTIPSTLTPNLWQALQTFDDSFALPNLTAHGVLLGEGASPTTATALGSGQLLIGQGASDPLALSVSGDCALSAAGALVCTKTSGTTFGPFATGTNAANLTGTLPTAQLPAFSGGDVSSTAGTPVLTVNSVLGGKTPLIHVASNATLQTVPSTAAPAIQRLGFYQLGDTPPLTYISSNTACPLNSGNGDNGSQVKSADNKCWWAVFPSNQFNVRWWGAICNGDPTTSPTDKPLIDVTALNATEAYAESQLDGTTGPIVKGPGGVVLIPQPTTTGTGATAPYGCYSALNVNGNGVTIMGVTSPSNASGGSKLLARTLTSSALTVNALSGFMLKDIYITSQSQQTSGQLVVMNGTVDAVFNNVSITHGWDLLESFNQSIFRWFGGHLRDFNHDGWLVTGNDPSKDNDFYIYGVMSDQDNNTYTPSSTMEVQMSAGAITLVGVDWIHGHNILNIDPASGQFVSWIYTVNSYFDSCDYGPTPGVAFYNGGTGIWVHPTGASTTVNGLFFTNTWAATCDTNVKIVGDGSATLSGIVFTSLHSLNAGKQAVYISNGRDIAFTAPLIAGSSQESSGTYPQIELDTGATHINMTGGRVGSPVEEFPTATAKFNLQLDAGFGTGILGVENVDLTGAVTNAVFIPSPSAASGTVIKDSPGFNPQGPATVTVPGTGPLVYTAGVTPETLNINGGALSGSGVTLSIGGTPTTVCAATPCVVRLAPHQVVTLNYSSAPTAVTNRE